MKAMANDPRLGSSGMLLELEKPYILIYDKKLSAMKDVQHTEVYENLLATGIIDPAKVSCIALENAGSTAGMVLTTETVVADKPEPKAAAAPAMPGGGDMDY